MTLAEGSPESFAGEGDLNLGLLHTTLAFTMHREMKETILGICLMAASYALLNHPPANNDMANQYYVPVEGHITNALEAGRGEVEVASPFSHFQVSSQDKDAAIVMN